MTPSRARRLAGWASLAALAAYWLTVTLGNVVELLEEQVDSLARENALLLSTHAAQPEASLADAGDE